MQIKNWKNTDNKELTVLAYAEKTIYKITSRPEDLFSILRNMDKGVLPSEINLTIPLIYIREIKHERGSNQFDILFAKNSFEHVRMDNEETIDEIFDFLTVELPTAKNDLTKQSFIKTVRNPVLAFLFVGLLFFYTYDVAVGMERGAQYELEGSPNSIVGIVFALSHLGSFKVMLIFSPLLLLTIIFFLRKAKNVPTLRTIFVRK